MHACILQARRSRKCMQFYSSRDPLNQHNMLQARSERVTETKHCCNPFKAHRTDRHSPLEAQNCTILRLGLLTDCSFSGIARVPIVELSLPIHSLFPSCDRLWSNWLLQIFQMLQAVLEENP